jgi:hypothetical protein
MQKLPVLAVASRVYQFLIGDFGTILRLSWLPLLIVTIVQYLAFQASLDMVRSAAEAGGLAGSRGTFGFFTIASSLVQLVGTAIVAVALHRVILFGDRKPGRFLYIAFGKTELLFVLLPFLVFILFVVLFLLVGFIAALVKPTAVVALILVAIAVMVLVYLGTRLSVIFPIIVVEGRYNFRAAWEATRGNFWRLFGLWLLVIVPVTIVYVAADWLIVPRALLGKPGNARDNVAAMMDAMSSALLAQSILLFLFSLVSGALVVATLSYSYKALSGHGPDDVLTPQG